MADIRKIRRTHAPQHSEENNSTEAVSYDDSSYFDQVSMNLHNSLGVQVEGISQVGQNTVEVLNNDNLSTSTKATALALNTAEAGMQALGALGAVDDAIESALLPALEVLGMSGMACLPISKQLDPVMGIDIHFVNIPGVPPPACMPMPHPYIGMLIRPKDFAAVAIASVIPPPPAPPAVEDPSAPTDSEQQALNMNKAANVGHMAASMAVGMLGATVKIGGFQPRAVAGTPTKNVPHFPMGPGFAPAFHNVVDKNIGHTFMGSFFTLADQDPLCGGEAHLHLSCNDVGMPSIHDTRPSKNTEADTDAKINLYLPTSVVMPIPPSRTILTNPVPTPMNPVSAVKQLFGASLGRFFRNKKRSDRMHDAVNNRIKSKRLNKMLHKAICTVTGHPVDVAKGNFFTDEEDFYLTGPIPLSWERTYYSNSDYEGPLGYGWHHSYDMAIHIDEGAGILTFRMNDGRPVAMELPRLDEPVFLRSEQIEAHCSEDGEYYIWNRSEEVFYYFTENEFEELRLLRSVVNKNGFGIQFKYDSDGYLIQMVDSALRELNVINDQNGRILEISAPHPEQVNETFNVASYEYDVHGNMIRQTNALGHSMHFEYDGRLMIKETWRNGLNWFFKYDGTQTGARCVHTWGDGDIQNHKLTFYDGLTEVENSLGHVTQYYHVGGLVIRRVDPNDAEHSWVYDQDNLMLAETDPLGNSYLYTYDDFGNKIQTIDPEGATTVTEYLDDNQSHLPFNATDANGGKWGFIYDKQDNLLIRKNPKGAASEFSYENGLLTDRTDALGNTTSFEYTEEFNIRSVRDSQDNIVRYEYDKLGQCTRITNPKGAIQTREFDLIGRITKVTDFDGNQIELSYDEIDNLLNYKDNLQEVKYSYKGMWKLTQRTDKRGTTRFYYNTEEQLTKIVNEKNVPYLFKLDSVGQIIEERGFDQETKRYTRDLAGQVIKRINASGRTTAYTYDKVGRTTQIKYNDKETQDFEYNLAGQLVGAVNKDARVSFKRNILGNVETEAINEHSISSAYDKIGRRTGLKSSLGADISYEHDSFGNLARLGVSTDQTDWEANYSYDSLGFELERMLPGKVQQSFDYDAIGRLTEQKTLQEKKQKRLRKYTWGTNDRLQKINDSKQGETRFGYTSTGHLEFSKYADGIEEYRKADKLGNLYEAEDLKDREYGFGGRLEKKGSWHYKYDSDGFLIEKYKGSGGLFSSRSNLWRYEWNAQGMLQTVTRPDGEKVHFTYDALGRRLSKKFKNTTTRWLWDGNVPIHEWKENSRGEILGDSSIGKGGVVTWVFEENSFIPTAKLKNNQKFSILSDHLGTPVQMLNDSGESVWERSLDSCGRVREGDHGSCPFMYQGQYYDKEIELAYNRFRYYDPEDGRYISQDPIGLLSGEFGFYNYVENPTIGTDVFGLVNSYRRRNGRFAKKPGPKKKKSTTHGNSVHSKKPRQHYVIRDDQGRVYHGVGDVKGNRANQSLARLEGENPDRTFVIQSQTNHSTSLGALKGEARGIRDTGGVNSDSNYNNINSPGAPYI